MASEHTLSLKATLDTADVQQKLDKLNQQSANVGKNVGGQEAAKDVNHLADAVKNLRRAIGGMTVVHSFANLAKAAKMFGDNTDQVVSQITSSMNNLMAAAMSGNVGVMALVAAMEIFGVALKSAQQELARVTKEAANLQVKWNTRREYGWSKFNRDAQEVAKHGDQIQQSRMLEDLYKRRSAAEADVDKKMKYGSGASAKEIESAIDNLKRLDAAISTLETGLSNSHQKLINEMVSQQDKEGLQDWLTALYNGGGSGNKSFDLDTIAQLEEALKKLNAALQEEADKAWKEAKEEALAEEERIRSLREAQEDWKTAEADYTATKKKDLAYFQQAMKDAQYAMEHAGTAEDFHAASSRYISARSQVDSIEQYNKSKEPKVKDYADLMQQLVGGAASTYSAAGFSMGETTDITDTVERQLDMVIRLLQDQLRKDLTVVNTSDNTI